MMAEKAYKPLTESVLKQEVQPQTVQVIPVYEHTSYDPIFSYSELSSAGDATLYTVNEGKVLMITAINLTTTAVGAITENSESTIWLVKSGGSSSTSTSRRICFCPEGQNAAGFSNIINLSFNPPIKVDQEVWAAVVMNMDDDDCHTRAQIYGYEIDKKVLPTS